MEDTPAAWRAEALQRAIAIEAAQKYGTNKEEDEA